MTGAREYVRAPSGLILPVAAAEERRRVATRPKAIDFFAGCGGFSLGILQAGFEVVAAVENDVHAVATYMLNLCRWGRFEVHYVESADKDRLNQSIEREWKRTGRKVSDALRDRSGLAGSGWISGQPATVPGVSHIFFGDARKLTADRILSDIGMTRGELDLVVGGPPCQGYSVSGKRNVMDPRSSLLFDFARFVVGLNPKAMAMENVPGIVTMLTPQGQPVLDQFCRILEDGGFGGFDAFQRVLADKPDAAGLMRGQPVRTRGKRARSRHPADASQPDLLVPADALDSAGAP